MRRPTAGRRGQLVWSAGQRAVGRCGSRSCLPRPGTSGV